MIVDVNVTLSRWPFRRLAGDETADMAARLRKRGVTQAWAGSFDGIFHKDLAGVNARLAAECRVHGGGLLLPFGSISPKLPDWREDLRRCIEDHRMAGIRLHPNYHGYKLDDPDFRELLRLASARKLPVQIALCMEDERTQHALMRVPPVDLAPLGAAIEAEPDLRLAILNIYPQLRLEALGTLPKRPGVCFDFSMTERIGAVSRLADVVGYPRVLFGSNAPLFYFEAAALKLKESGLTAEQSRMVCVENARRLLAK